MQKLILSIITLISCLSFSQQEKAKVVAEKKSNNYIYEANAIVNEDFVTAEMAYRKALSQQSNNVAGLYNLGHSYYKTGNYAEALYRHQQTAKLSTSKIEKHKAFHNIGNILMQEKKCKEAVEAYKNALRNNPSDEETRYNFGLAKACAKQQEDENKDDNDKNDENKEDKDNSEDKKDENKENKDDKKNDDKENKEGDDKDKEDKENDEKDKKEEDKKPEDADKKKDKGKGDEDKKEQQPQPQQGQLSPQQIKNLLEAMNNQEQKVQEKMNLKKQKGVKVKTEKDW